MMQLPKEMILTIASFLDYKSKIRLSSVSKFFNKTLRDDKEIQQEIQQRKQRIVLTVTETVKAIKHYIDKHADVLWCATEGPILKTKGTKRAYTFYCILEHETISLQFKFLSVYALLTEKNGERLKNIVNQQLTEAKLLNLPLFKSIILREYDLKDGELPDWCDKLIKEVHASGLNDLFEDPYCSNDWSTSKRKFTTKNQNWLAEVESKVIASNPMRCVIS